MITVVIASNIFPIAGLFSFLLDEKHYRYSYANGSFTSYEFMGRRFDSILSMHAGCLSNNDKLKDKKLYRLFSKNPLAFWRWRLYFYDERYQLPYKNWEEIEKKRGKVKETQGCSISF